jgi:hypothetical protein
MSRFSSSALRKILGETIDVVFDPILIHDDVRIGC